MIVVDTSALIAIAQDEPQAQDCMKILSQAERILISAGTLTELLILASRRKLRAALSDLFVVLNPEVIPATADSAHRSAEAYEKWGKGVHPARLNFGDCFAYELAMSFQCPLLYIGQDFAQTDVQSAL